GLFDMAGNVAEWTANAFDESAYSFMHDMNPDYKYEALPDDPPSMKRKSIRGGSWKDIGYFLQNGTRTYEFQDSAKSYIGFRCVRSYLGVN
ncbi:MAG: gliding motility-associated lipoprotein, partial [Marinilabiliales bacterium]